MGEFNHIKKEKIKEFFRRQIVAPFETTFAFICIYSGAVALMGYSRPADLFRESLGTNLADIYNVIYLFAGLSLFVGIGLSRINIEAVGLIIVSMSLVVRTIVVLYMGGITQSQINMMVFAIAFVFACGIRLWSLTRYQWVVQPKPPPIVRAMNHD